MKRARSLALIVVLVVSAVAGVATVGASAPDDTRNASDGYTLEELERGGPTYENAPDSIRVLEDEPGSVSVRYEPSGPFAKPWAYLEPGEEIHANQVKLRSSRYATESRTVTVVVVYWRPATREVSTPNGTVTREVADVSGVERKNVTLGPNYDTSELDLRKHTGEPVRVTMWIEGQEGARWTFQHRSIATSSAVEINTMGGLLGWLTTRVLVYVIPGILFTFWLGSKVLDRAGAGPQLGPVLWLVVVSVVAFLLVGFAWFQIGTIFSRAPQLIAAMICLMSFIGVVEGKTGVQTVMFERDDLEHAEDPESDSVKDTRYQDCEEHKIVRVDDGETEEWALVKPGIRPFLGRVFGAAASLPTEDLATDIEVRGDWTRKYISDPAAEDPLRHVPPRLTFNPRPFRDDVDPDGALEAVRDGLNWPWLAKAGLGALVTYHVIMAVFALSTVAFLASLAVVGVASLDVRDGFAEFSPAPIHYTRARAQLVHSAKEYEEAKTVETANKRVLEERLRPLQKAEESLAQKDRTLIEQLLDPDDEVGRGLGVDDVENVESRRRRAVDDVDETGGLPVTPDDERGEDGA